jgi:cation diffusion facilitator CzcD-associated flavoprotein CzcO
MEHSARGSATGFSHMPTRTSRSPTRLDPPILWTLPFQGPSFHTHYCPKEPVRFAGKRVAVIGTGATSIQTITEVAKTAGHLTVFQRTPQWAAPLHNAKITKEEMDRIS